MDLRIILLLLWKGSILKRTCSRSIGYFIAAISIASSGELTISISAAYVFMFMFSVIFNIVCNDKMEEKRRD